MGSASFAVEESQQLTSIASFLMRRVARGVYAAKLPRSRDAARMYGSDSLAPNSQSTILA
jgi:hypothetical protein